MNLTSPRSFNHYNKSRVETNHKVSSHPQKLELSTVEHGYNQLTYLISEKFDKNKILRLIDSCDDITKIDGHGKAAIHWASLLIYGTDNQEMLTVLGKLLDCGAIANDRSINGDTPLHCMMKNVVSFSGSEKLISFMVSRGANPAITNNSGETPVMNVLNNWDLEMEDQLKLIDKLFSYFSESQLKKEIARILCLLIENNKYSFDLPFTISEAKTLIKYFSRKINLGEVRTQNGIPLLHQLLTESSWEEKEVYELAKLLLSKGANPNATTKEGLTALHCLSIKKRLSVARRTQLMKLLKKHSADVTLKTKKEKGPLSLMFSQLNGVIPEEEIIEYLGELYGCDMFTEYNYRELLVNSFALGEYETQLGYESLSLSGSYSVPRISDFLTSHSAQYYNELVFTIKNPMSSEAWSKIFNRCSKETKAYLSKGTAQNIEAIGKVLQRIPGLQKTSATAQKMPAKKIYGAIRQSAPIAFLVSHPEHAVGYFSYNDRFYVCNKGYGSGVRNGISVHNKSSIQNIEQLSKDLHKGIDAKKFNKTHFPSRFTSAMDPRLKKILFMIEQGPQKMGNCPVASYNSLELAILFALLSPIFKNNGIAEEFSRAVKSTHSAIRREKILEKYLQLHSDPKNKMPPIDNELLTQLALKKTSNSDLDSRRQKMILEFLSTTDLPAYTKLSHRIEMEADEQQPDTIMFMHSENASDPGTPPTPGQSPFEEKGCHSPPRTPEWNISDNDEYHITSKTPGWDFSDSEDFLATPKTPVWYYSEDEEYPTTPRTPKLDFSEDEEHPTTLLTPGYTPKSQTPELPSTPTTPGRDVFDEEEYFLESSSQVVESSSSELSNRSGRRPSTKKRPKRSRSPSPPPSPHSSREQAQERNKPPEKRARVIN